jgi:FtsP/CotA-like multicopper oxidase with cupredoxin domain
VHIPLEQPTGTFWYHSHLHGISDEQLMGGLSGLLIVDGITHYLPKAWRDAQLPVRAMALRDVQIQPQPPLSPSVPADPPEVATEANIDPNQPSTRLLNALYQPTFSMQAHRYERWELANVGSDVFYSLKFESVDANGVANGDVRRFVVIAVDGVPVWDVTTQSQLIMPPGRRYDVLVEGGNEGGSYVLRSQRYAQTTVPKNGVQKGRLIPVPPGVNPFDPGPPDTDPIPSNQILARVAMTKPTRPQDPMPLPRHLAVRITHAPSTKEVAIDPKYPLEDLSHEHVDKHRTFIFSYTAPGAVPFRALIGVPGKPAVPFTPTMQPLANPVLGDVEEWTLRNETLDQHPFHIHVNAFQVMSINGRPVHATGHEDVVTIPEKVGDVPGEVVIRTKFLRFIGWFVFHCHILNHEDLGMMATIQVRAHKDSPTTPPPEGMIAHMDMPAGTGMAAAGGMAMP